MELWREQCSLTARSRADGSFRVDITRERSCRLCLNVLRSTSRATAVCEGLGHRLLRSMSAQRVARRRRGLPWDEESIREALSSFLRGRTAWPTYDEFIAAGLKGLRDVLPRFGGSEHWAREMGLKDGPLPSGGVLRWTDDAIRAALSQLLDGRSTWPTNGEFRRAGLGGLYEKLSCEGLVERWANEFGIAPPPFAHRPRRAKPQRSPRPAPQPRLWTDSRIADELAAFLGKRRDWPSFSEFVEGDRVRLYKAVLNHGGTQQWAQRMGVEWASRRGRSHPQQWTEERVRERLTEMLRGRTIWPTAAEFDGAGQRGLLVAARRLGGIERWATELDVSRPTRSDGSTYRRGDQRSWTDARISEAIGPLIEELGRWPTKAEFRRAGLGAALSAVYDHGGRRVWQQRLGVTARPFDGPVPDRSRWNEETIEATLRDFCQNRSAWPTLREFEAAGLIALYRAAGKHGGVAYWRARLGFS